MWCGAVICRVVPCLTVTVYTGFFVQWVGIVVAEIYCRCSHLHNIVLDCSEN